MNGTFRLARQAHARAYYGAVDLRVAEEVDTPGITVLFNDLVEPRWRAALTFGIEYAFEHTHLRPLPRATVTVDAIAWHEVDTTHVLMAYAAAMATFAATGTEPPAGLTLDDETGTFKFPR